MLSCGAKGRGWHSLSNEVFRNARCKTHYPKPENPCPCPFSSLSSCRIESLAQPCISALLVAIRSRSSHKRKTIRLLMGGRMTAGCWFGSSHIKAPTQTTQLRSRLPRGPSVARWVFERASRLLSLEIDVPTPCQSGQRHCHLTGQRSGRPNSLSDAFLEQVVIHGNIEHQQNRILPGG